MKARDRHVITELSTTMITPIDEQKFKSKITTFLDPSAQTGSLLSPIVQKLRYYGHSEENIKSRIFGFFDDDYMKNYAINKYKLVGNFDTINLLKCKIDKTNALIFYINNKEYKMKFDVITANPPYKGDLHLKFLQLCVDILKEDGKIVWLHPSRWAQDPFAPYKKNSDYNKYKHLPFVNFEIVDDANEKFGIGAHSQIMISTLDKSKTSILNNGYFVNGPFLNKSSLQKNVFDKVRLKMKTTLADVVKMDEPYIDKYCVMVSPIGPGSRKVPTRGYLTGKKWRGVFENGKLNGKKVREIKTKQRHVKEYDKIFFIPFNTKGEAENFIKSSETDFIKFWMTLITSNIHIMFNSIPFMNNYNKIWTDEDYKRHFNLSNEEMEYIKSQIQ